MILQVLQAQNLSTIVIFMMTFKFGQIACPQIGKLTILGKGLQGMICYDDDNNHGAMMMVTGDL